MKKERKLRILHLLVFPLWGSGSGTYVRELARVQSKQFNVAVACPDEYAKENFKVFNIGLPFEVAFTGHPKFKKCKLYSELTTKEIIELYTTWLKKVQAVVAEFKPDFIHAHHASVMSWIARYIKAMYGVPYIITSHSTCVYNASKDVRYVALTYDALRAASMVTAVSSDTRDRLLKVFHLNHGFSKRTRTIPCAINIDKYPKNKPIKLINKKYNLQGKNVVLTSSKITPEKGVIYLVKAAKKIKGEVFIIGGGEELKNLEKYVQKNHLDNVHILGYFDKSRLNELQEFYYRADVSVAPSIWNEGLPMSILEAMAGSTPIVATRMGGISLAVKNNVNGLFVRTHSSRQIVEAVNRILANPKLKERLGENARLTVEKKFTWEKISQRYQRIYRKYERKSLWQ